MPDRPVDVWRRKLEHLQKAEATASDPAQLFSIREQIKEAEQRIAELESASPRGSAPQAGPAAPAGSLREPPLTEHAERETFEVFLSHNSQDKQQVREIAERLLQRGVKVWLDEWELRPGLTWMDALEDIIEGCGFRRCLHRTRRNGSLGRAGNAGLATPLCQRKEEKGDRSGHSHAVTRRAGRHHTPSVSGGFHLG